MAKSEHIEQTLARLPQQPGVYQYFDVDRRLLYVGKAKNLKKRVSSYFTKHHDNGKTRLLVSKIHDIQWLIAPSEADALLLENSLIKEHKPFYNIQLKDDKTYPFIVIKKERFPRIFATRQLIRDGSDTSVPSPASRSCTPFWTCAANSTPFAPAPCPDRGKHRQRKFRVCLEYHIGNCKGPCVGKQSEEAYAASIAAIRHVLRGHLGEVVRTLQSQMAEAAEAFQFEEAEQYKRKLTAVKKYQAKNTIVHTGITEVEVYSIVQDARCAYVNFLKIQNGTITKGHTSEVRRKLGEDTKEILEAAIRADARQVWQRRQHHLHAVRNRFAARGVQLHVPQRGDKLRLVEMSERNARFFMRDRQKQMEQTHPEAATQRLLETAKEDLRLTELPVHIECFDNSNIQGTNPASACVVFKNGKPAKSDYRKFNIRTVDGPDDFASMTEVVHRRYHRLLTEGEPCLSSSSSTAEKGNSRTHWKPSKGWGCGVKSPSSASPSASRNLLPRRPTPAVLGQAFFDVEAHSAPAQRGPPIFIGASPQAPQQGRAPFRVGRHRRRRAQNPARLAGPLQDRRRHPPSG